MKLKVLFSVLATAVLASAAQADDFSCTLDITTDGSPAKTATAERYKMEVAVADSPFVCVGQYYSNASPAFVKVILISSETGELVTAYDKKAELYSVDSRGDGLEHATCSCGLN